MMNKVGLLCSCLVALAVRTAGQIVTTGGEGIEGARCVFPFTYQETPTTDCISDNFCAPWCGTTTDYDEDKRWGICVLPKEGGAIGTYDGNANCADCVFPFTYNGVVRDSCITDDDTKLWCGTTDDYPNDRIWGYCISSQTSTTSSTTTTSTTTTLNTDPSSNGTTTPCNTPECLLAGGNERVYLHSVLITLLLFVFTVLYM